MKHFAEDIVRACKNGDRLQQKQVFEQLYAPMYRVCLRYVVSQPEAEDCTMKGFMRMFQNLEGFVFDGPHSLFVWVRKIMVNEALMELRKRNSFYLMPEDSMSELPDQSDILQQLHAEDIFKLISKLPTGYRTVFNLFVVEGYSHQEIAQMLAISENTSKTQYLKARHRMKTMIEQMHVPYGKTGK